MNIIIILLLFIDLLKITLESNIYKIHTLIFLFLLFSYLIIFCGASKRQMYGKELVLSKDQK